MSARSSILGPDGRPTRTDVPGPASARGRAARTLAARYDAATYDLETARHWAQADGLSANAANDPEVRRRLRNRARYESANNSYARGICLTLANDVVGTGPRLQLLGADRDAGRAVEVAFGRWADAVDLAQKLRTMRQAVAVDGEAFAVLGTNPGLPTAVQLDIRPIEADRVATPAPDPLDPLAVDGIAFDPHGNPREYHILRDHPGDAGGPGVAWGEFDRVPARLVVHWFRPDRPGQARGVPDITPALPLFAQLRRYTLAVLAAAETAANFSAVVQSALPPDEGLEPYAPFDQFPIERNTMTTLPMGWTMAQLRAEQPATTYEMFKRELLNEIARCLNMPYNVAAGNSSAYNYASGRLDHQTYYKSLRVDRAQAERVVLERLLAAWLAEAVRVADVPLDAPGWPHEWRWDGTEHVDPEKEAKAQETRLKNHTTTLAVEYSRQGLDWEDELRQRAKEVALMEELGLPQPAPAGAGPFG